MSFPNFQVITNGDMSLATLESAWISMNQFKSISFQAVFTGAPVGVIEIEVSNDVVNDPADVVNSDTLAGSSFNISAAGIYSRDTVINYAWARVLYTKTSGSGSLNVNANVKVSS